MIWPRSRDPRLLIGRLTEGDKRRSAEWSSSPERVLPMAAFERAAWWRSFAVGAALLALSWGLAAFAAPAATRPTLVALFEKLTKATPWRLVGTIEMRFRTFHPQGMVVIGDEIFFSAVEVTLPTRRHERAIDGYDRSPGAGVGHLFKADHSGELIASIRLGERRMYHPGGIDYDGNHLWVPVSEYRPHSESIVYRVKPSSMRATEVFRFRDHVGDVLRNPADNTLHGLSWGSRFFYTWKLDDRLQLAAGDLEPTPLRTRNGNHYIDYQDCHYLGGSYALCGGVNAYSIPILGKYALGGLDLVDLSTHQAVHQIPVAQWVHPGLVMTTNPFFVELAGDRLRFYFMPGGDSSIVYIYETKG